MEVVLPVKRLMYLLAKRQEILCPSFACTEVGIVGIELEPDTMVQTIEHRIQFQLYSDDANFGTGVGWREYFLPFCEEVHESFHQKYNFHRLPSWQHIFKQCCCQKSVKPFVWKAKKTVMTIVGRLVALSVYKERVLFAQDVPRKTEQWYHQNDDK